ncbi:MULTISPECIES: hypothetical protein [unclassified Lysobacter]|uniref:hypothetical protein n=1 Tax=unclassified Lysobacter TaxID=2635362 RepID=UPI001F57877B|nr:MULTISPECIES: hypothetical protein [unclassified Lysobacter]
MNTRHAAILVFVLMACVIWLPFDAYTDVYGTKRHGAVPAGEIAAGFHLLQIVEPAAIRIAQPPAPAPYCFAIQFATYARSNAGKLQVGWTQAGHQLTWTIKASDLADNTYRHFCPNVDFRIYEPYVISIAGIDGKPGNSPTVWLVGDTRLGTAQLPDASLKTKGLALSVASLTRVDTASALRVGHGAFLLGWVCTLAAGILALLTAIPRGR